MRRVNLYYLSQLKDTYNLEIENDKLPYSLKPNYDIEYTKLIWDSILNSNCNNTINKPVFPRGNIEADIMIIGQNPGGRGKGDYTTIWNGGPNSKFIIEATKEAGIYYNSWFTNLVPFPTIDNKITKVQIEESKHLLDLQIRIIKPKVFIGLGKGVNSFLKKYKLGQCPIIELQHPAYVRRFLSGDPKNRENYVQLLSSSKVFI